MLWRFVQPSAFALKNANAVRVNTEAVNVQTDTKYWLGHQLFPMYRKRMPSFPRMKPLLPSKLTAYRLPAMPSVDRSLFHDFPPSSLLNRLPLPPHANPSSEFGLKLQQAPMFCSKCSQGLQADQAPEAAARAIIWRRTQHQECRILATQA